jgi:hypothetical protein
VHYWEQQAAEQVLFCTVTALGLVRLVCQPCPLPSKQSSHTPQGKSSSLNK